MVNAEWPEEPFWRDVDACIGFYNGRIELTPIGSGEILAGDGHVGYGWHRGLHVDIEKSTTSEPPSMGMASRLAIPALSANCEVIATREEHQFDGRGATMLYEGALTESLVWSKEPAHEVRFDIAGLVQTTMLRQNEAHWHGKTRRLLLEAGRWQVRIVELEDARERRAEAKRAGKSPITHTARVSTTDRDRIRSDDVRTMLHALTWLLSFASGAWVALVGPTGLDESGDAVWGRWGQPRWSPPSGWRWLGAHHPEALCVVWPHWWQLWQSPSFGEALKWSVAPYVEACLNRAGLEVSIPAAFTALEILAWHHATHARGLTTRQAKKETAEERLESLLRDTRVPLEVPPQLAAAHEWARTSPDREVGPDDGPAVVANLRNRIEHPRDTKRVSEIPPRARYELLQLSLWWIELVLLGVCHFDDHYRARTNPLIGRSRMWARPSSGVTAASDSVPAGDSTRRL